MEHSKAVRFVDADNGKRYAVAAEKLGSNVRITFSSSFSITLSPEDAAALVQLIASAS